MSKTIYDGVTAMSITGGTSKTFEEVASAASGVTYVNATDGSTDGLFETIRVVGKQGNTVSGAKFGATAVVTIPTADAVTGEVRYATLRVELKVDPREHATTQLELRMRAAQILTQAGFETLFEYGQE